MKQVSHIGGNHNVVPHGVQLSRLMIQLYRPLRRLPPGAVQLRLTDVRRSTDSSPRLRYGGRSAQRAGSGQSERGHQGNVCSQTQFQGKLQMISPGI